MEKNESVVLIESILFYEKESITANGLSKITGLEVADIHEIIDSLKSHYREHHGFDIVETADGYSIQLKKETYKIIKDIYDIKPKNGLSKSLMTVLSIIAYKQPITKGEIEEIRGVSSDNAVKVLLEKGIIEITGRKEAVGKPILYGTSQLFLKLFNLRSINDLPKINELKSEEFGL